MFDVQAFAGYFDNAFLLRGVLVTVWLTAAGMAGGLVVGLLVACMRASGGPVLRRMAADLCVGVPRHAACWCSW